MSKVDDLWAIECFEQVDKADLDAWVETNRIRRQFEKDGCTDAALVKAALELSWQGTGVPKCLRTRLFLLTASQLSAAKSWDEAFGPLHPKGKHLKPRKPLPDPVVVWSHIFELVAGEGMPLTVSTFEQAGEELGIGARTCQKIYQEFSKEHGVSLAGQEFSERAREQAAMARKATVARLNSQRDCK